MLRIVTERIVELCGILLPVLQKLEGSSTGLAFIVIVRTGAQIAMFRDGKEEVLHIKLIRYQLLLY